MTLSGFMCHVYFLARRTGINLLISTLSKKGNEYISNYSLTYTHFKCCKTSQMLHILVILHKVFLNESKKAQKVFTTSYHQTALIFRQFKEKKKKQDSFLQLKRTCTNSMDTKGPDIIVGGGKGREEQEVCSNDRRQVENGEGRRSQKSRQKEVRDQRFCQPTINQAGTAMGINACSPIRGYSCDGVDRGMGGVQPVTMKAEHE